MCPAAPLELYAAKPNADGIGLCVLAATGRRKRPRPARSTASHVPRPALTAAPSRSFRSCRGRRTVQFSPTQYAFDHVRPNDGRSRGSTPVMVVAVGDTVSRLPDEPNLRPPCSSPQVRQPPHSDDI